MVLVNTVSWSQSLFYQPFADTIKPGYRISGDLDSVDWNSTFQPFTNSPYLLKPSRANSILSFFTHPVTIPETKRYSSIPHVGLLYAFGSNATQTAKISYTQQTDTNHFLQFDYSKNYSNGLMRNSKYDVNQFDFNWSSQFTKYAQSTNLVFYSANEGLSGGLLGDTLNNDLGVAFQPVKKTDAEATRKHVIASTEHYFSLTNQQKLKTGWFIHGVVDVTNRRYSESGQLDLIYPVILFDTTSTTDYYQFSNAGGNTGYFLHSKSFQIELGAELRQQQYDNIYIHQDTLVAALTGKLFWNIRDKLLVSSRLNFNLLGSVGAIQSFNKIAINIGDWKLNGTVNFDRNYPTWNQRSYVGNTVNYNWTNKQLITHFQSSLRISKSWKKCSFSAVGGTELLWNEAILVNYAFRQDTLSFIQHNHVGVRGELNVGRFFIQPAIQLHQTTQSILPPIQLNARMAYRGTIGKRKKLMSVIGVEGGYYTSFTTMDFVPVLGYYTFSNTNTSFSSMPYVHVFGQFDLGFLRWFVRVENLEQIGQTQENQEAIGYLINPMQIRMGISWDLFN